MPYIDKNQRQKYNKVIDVIGNTTIETKGDLEYLVFSLMQKFMKTREFRYSTLHEVVYAVMHCADEYRRRFLDNREDEARKTNGDIE
jgi:hypothetical protein